MMLRHLARRLPEWDPASKMALGLGLVLLLLMVWLGFRGPEPVQLPARIGAFGLLLTIQLLVLWGNRRVLSPYHQAQQHFIHGDYLAARDILEMMPQSSPASVDALVLLGNTYRHLGQFEKSRAALEHALGLKPNYHFALYGMGKLNLTTGDYEAAVRFITKALLSGSPDGVQFDLGQAFYLLDDAEKSNHYFNNINSIIADEPAQAMLMAYYRFVMGTGERPSHRSIQEHIHYWQQEAVKYRQTPYGAALQKDVDALSACLKDAQAPN